MDTKTRNLIAFEYGAMSSRYRMYAENKLTAYAAMVLHYDRSAHLLLIYSPETSKTDQGASFDGKISKRLDEIFGGENGFDIYVEAHTEEIRDCYASIEKLI